MPASRGKLAEKAGSRASDQAKAAAKAVKVTHTAQSKATTSKRDAKLAKACLDFHGMCNKKELYTSPIGWNSSMHLPLKTVAGRHKLDYATLKRAFIKYMAGEQGEGSGRKTLLSPAEQTSIRARIDYCTLNNRTPTRLEIRGFARDILSRRGVAHEPGATWCDDFIKKQPDGQELTERINRSLSQDRSGLTPLQVIT
jgi:hypothetical protein